jgi:hypothetical protein
VVTLAVLPATTILPLGCTSTTFAASTPPKLIVFFPSPEKLVSRSPGLAMRRPYPRIACHHTLEASTRLSAVYQRRSRQPLKRRGLRAGDSPGGVDAGAADEPATG